MSDHPPDPPSPVRRGRVRIFLRIVVVALVVIAAGLFFARRQIGDRLERSLDEWLTAAGVFVSWQSADWLPGVGIRLHGLALYRDAAKHDRLALFGMVTAIKGDEAWHRWDKLNFKTADTQVVLGGGVDETKLEHLDMLLLIQPGTTELRTCHASLSGLRVEVNGEFLHAAPAGGGKPEAAAKQAAPVKGLFSDVRLDWLKPVKEWMKFQPGKDEPVLRVELHSLPQGRGLELAMTFDGTSFQWRGEKWDFMQAAAKTLVDGKKSPIEVDYWRIGHAGRKAEIAGAFDPDSGVVRISKLDSGIDLLALARALVPGTIGSSPATKTTGAWRISGAGEIPVEHPENGRWEGGMALDGDFRYVSGGTKIALQKPAFAIRVNERVVSISDLQAGLWGGTLDAPKAVVHLPSAKTNLRIETQATLRDADRQSVVDSLGGAQKQPDFLPLNWTGTWRINGAGETPGDQPGSWRWNGDLALDGELLVASGGTKVALQNPAGTLSIEDQVVTLSDFKAGLWDGNLDVSKAVVYLPSTKTKLRIETHANLRDARLQSVIDSFGGARKQPGVVLFSAKGTWRIDGVGEIPVDHPENWRWKGDVALDGEFLFSGGGTKIALQKPALSLRVDGPVVTLSDFKAGLWDGSLVASKTLVHLPSAKKNLRFETQATLNGTRLPPIIDSFNGAQKQPGSVPYSWTGAWRISGAGEVPMDRPESWRWNGDMALDGDLLFAGGGTKIALQKPTFALRVDGPVVTLSDFKAGVWDGSLGAPKTVVYLPSAKKKLRFETQATLRDARLQSVVASFGVVRKEPGTVQCDWKGGGEFELASLTGSGALSIGDTGFAHIPIFGGMYALFKELTPRFRGDVASTMTVKHRMADGTLHLEDLKLDSKQTHIEASGAIDLVRDHARITAHGRLRGITGLATVILASLLEFQGEGPVRDMHWKLKSIPGVGLIGKAAKKITGKEKGAVKGTGGGVKGSHGSDSNQPPGR